MNWRHLLKSGQEKLGQERRLELERYLAELRGGSRASLLAHLDDHPNEEQIGAFESALERLLQGEPIQYLLGKAPFWDMELTVNPSVLIPRFDTELLVQQAVQRGQGMGQPLNILDLCTGSGAIACALARALPTATVYGGDISRDALDVACANARQWAPNVQFRLGDLFSSWENMKFNMICSNPPYISDEEMSELSDQVLREPHLALWGGVDGLDFYRRMISDSPSYLSADGWLLFEIGYQQGPEVRQLFLEAGFDDVQIYKDEQGWDRVVEGRLKIV